MVLNSTTVKLISTTVKIVIHRFPRGVGGGGGVGGGEPDQF